MKKTLLILGILGAVAAMAVTAALLMTRGLVDQADRFLAEVRQGHPEQAWSYLSEGFRANTDRDALAHFLDQQMRGATTAEWHTRRVHNGQGRLEGALVTSGEARIPIAIDFVRENGTWKIHRIERTPAGLREQGPTLTVPDVAEAQSLVAQTTDAFFRSLAEGDMRRFHDHISGLWQAQFSVAELDEGYRAFLDLDFDYASLVGKPPTLEGNPQLDADSVLELNAHLPSEIGLFRFGIRYVLENGQWKPLGLNVRIE
ncbi:MAG: hypothetical protein Kow0020_14300 [Wenzhouxiangellaceae bacterium]